MGFVETQQSWHTSLSNNQFTVGATTPVQISGGGPYPNVLPGVAAGFSPSYNRQGFILTNNSTGGQVLYIGRDNTVTSAGANSTGSPLAAGQSVFIPGQGSLVRYVISSMAGALVDMEEVQ